MNERTELGHQVWGRLNWSEAKANSGYTHQLDCHWWMREPWMKYNLGNLISLCIPLRNRLESWLPSSSLCLLNMFSFIFLWWQFFFLTPSIKTNALNREKVSLPVYYSLISSMPNLLDVSSQFRCSGSDKQIYMRFCRKSIFNVCICGLPENSSTVLRTGISWRLTVSSCGSTITLDAFSFCLQQHAAFVVVFSTTQPVS